jgi:hypothetical protein
MRDTLILAQKAEASATPQLPPAAVPSDVARQTEQTPAE